LLSLLDLPGDAEAIDVNEIVQKLLSKILENEVCPFPIEPLK